MRPVLPTPRAVMLRLDRSIHGVARGDGRRMGPPVKPEGDGGWGGDGRWAEGGGGWTAPFPGPATAQPERRAGVQGKRLRSRQNPAPSPMTRSAFPAVTLRPRRSIHGAARGDRGRMGPPVKPEGDGGWGGDGRWAEADGSWGAPFPGPATAQPERRAGVQGKRLRSRQNPAPPRLPHRRTPSCRLRRALALGPGSHSAAARCVRDTVLPPMPLPAPSLLPGVRRGGISAKRKAPHRAAPVAATIGAC
ncbi:hypothetical protein FHS53_001950 [Xanthobacter tagetidis]|nr:hypothetical protein [Xanthobacter tagetidis]